MDTEKIEREIDETRAFWGRADMPVAFVVSPDIAELVRERAGDSPVWVIADEDRTGALIAIHQETARRLAPRFGWKEAGA